MASRSRDRGGTSRFVTCPRNDRSTAVVARVPSYEARLIEKEMAVLKTKTTKKTTIAPAIGHVYMDLRSLSLKTSERLITIIGTAGRTRFRAVSFYPAGTKDKRLPKATVLSKATLGNGNFKLLSKLVWPAL